MDSRRPGRIRAYLLQRASDERRAAAQANCNEARLVHRQLARRYAAEAWEARADERAAEGCDPSKWSRHPREKALTQESEGMRDV